jgi:hypothetical protein
MRYYYVDLQGLEVKQATYLEQIAYEAMEFSRPETDKHRKILIFESPPVYLEPGLLEVERLKRQVRQYRQKLERLELELSAAEHSKG